MHSMTCDVAVVGGGPAGLAAAVGARKAGAEKIAIVERDKRLGGILHDGEWYHVGTPEALAEAEETLATARVWL